MQDIFVFKPYQFVPPVRSRWASRISRFLGIHRHLIWRLEGVRGYEVRGAEWLQQSLDQGHSILLAPNHSRTADPIALGFLEETLHIDMYAMASWHLFNVGSVMRWFIRSMGAFSVNREGMDRRAIDTAIELLAQAERPLVIFPEGSTSRTNDQLMPFLDGISFIARAAAKQRQRKDDGRVVIHPVAFKYIYQGDIVATGTPIVEKLERQLTWYPGRSQDLLERITNIALAQLGLKEIERLGEVQSGDLADRLTNLREAYLRPIEEKWLGAAQSGTSTLRIKNLRSKIIPQLIEEGQESPNAAQYLADIHDTYVAHQLACHPLPYLNAKPTQDRVREAIERLEEDATDRATLHRPLKCVIQIAPAIEVSTTREKRGSQGDPVMEELASSLQATLDALAGLSAPFASHSSTNRHN